MMDIQDNRKMFDGRWHGGQLIFF